MGERAQPQFFQGMARNNRWSNYRLLKACAQLSQAEFDASRTSFFPSISQTFNHLLIVDWYYIDALYGGTQGRKTFADLMPCKGVAELTLAQQASDGKLIAFCERLDEAGISKSINLDRGSNGIQRELTGKTLMHLFVHQIHHRGQIHAMLAGTAIKPPQLDDFFLDGDAPVRAADMQALGFNEETIIKK